MHKTRHLGCNCCLHQHANLRKIATLNRQWEAAGKQLTPRCGAP